MAGSTSAQRQPVIGRVLARLRADYPASLTALGICGALFPYVVVLHVIDAQGTISVPVSVVVLACAGTMLTCVTLLRALAPLRKISSVLGVSDDGAARDPGWRLASAVEEMERSVAALRRDIAGLAVSSVPERVRLLAEMRRDMSGTAEPIALGLVRFTDFERLAAFDPKQAVQVLDSFALRAQQAVARNYVFAQVGAETFAIWFRGVSAGEGAAALRAIAYALAQDLPVGETTIRPRLEVGGAIHPSDGDDADALLARAYASLSERSDAAAPAFFSRQREVEARTRFIIEQDIAGAIRRQELQVHYQPVVDLSTARLVGAEALVRWRHPELGAISPSQFIPVIEQSPAMEEVGIWVLNTACRQARVWRETGLDLRMAVNLSARQLRNPALTEIITRTLERHHLAPCDLELELTETATMEDAGRTLAVFKQLHKLGIGLAIDDFGSGYSSLAYLKTLPFTKLKIDREFVTQVERRTDSNAICRSLVELSKGLSIRVLAEGVESRAEVEALRGLGCTMFQGFYFGKPMAADDFRKHVENPLWSELLASPVHRERADLERRVGR